MSLDARSCLSEAPPAAGRRLDLSRQHPDAYAGEEEGPLAIDRQRVICASAFRRLQYKTQVFVSRQGDHFRSRLTHTLEVANLARAMAGRLGLAADLAEVVALAHDLGHPPFGHAGERALDERLRAHTNGAIGFEHNDHSLRVVEHLEHPYPEFRGLNLTAEVRRCLRSHSTKYDRAESGAEPEATLESQVVAHADHLAYAFHDLQDGVHAGLITPERLETIELWRMCAVAAGLRGQVECRRRLRPAVEAMQRYMIRDLACEAPRSDDSSGAAPQIAFSESAKRLLDQLDERVAALVYRDRQVVRMDAKARRIVAAVFDAYVAEPRLMPGRFAQRVEEQGAARVAADYTAGMTDRFCQDEHARLFDSRMEA